MAPSSRTDRSSQARSPRRGIVLALMIVMSLGIGALVVVALFMLLGTPRTSNGWIWTAALGLVGAWIAYVALSIGQRTSDALDEGTAMADAKRGDRMEATGRRAGRVVGGGMAKLAGRSRPTTADPSPDESSTDSTTAATTTSGPGLDDTARVLGQMVGRRLDLRRSKG